MSDTQNATPIPSEPIDLDALFERCMGSQVFVKKLLSELEATGLQRLQEIRDLASGERYDALEESAHSLKGAMAIIGAQQLQRLAAQIEQSARTGAIEPMGPLVHDLGDEMRRCLNFVARYLKDRQPDEEPPHTRPSNF